MAATITGIVFHDQNHNGIYDTGEPAIANVFVVLSGATGCVSTQTDANGNYSFLVTTAGTYTVYETVADPGDVCPPTVFTQPAGFLMSNGPRKGSVTLTAAQVNAGATVSGPNFAHDTVDASLACTTDFIQFVGDPTNWYNIDVVTGKAIFYGQLNPADYVNAIGYNILDDYIYGYDLTINQIVRVDAAGNIMALGLPTGLPVQGYNTGCVDANGFSYITLNNTARFYTIDLRPNSATFMKLVNPTNGYVEQTSNYGVAFNNLTPNVSDWVADEAGFLYGIQPNGVMYRVNLANGNVIALTTHGPNPNASFGAIGIDGGGNIYAIENQAGGVYRYTFNGLVATGVYFSTTYFDSHNDGCMCRNAQVLLDLGDAPDLGTGGSPGNYNTLLASNGPRHQVRDTLTLGTQVTAEPDAYQNSDATGDDLTQGVQDDGLATPLPVLSISATTYALDVTVTNDTGTAANLYAWVDFNQNGLFEPAEAAPEVSVPSLPGQQTVTVQWTVPSGTVLSPGNTFVRLRVTTDTLASGADVTGQDAASVGPAFDGEVEDYILTVAPVADLTITKTANPETAQAGTPLTYTLTVTNNGPDLAQSPLVTDNIPSELKNVVYSLDNGATWDSWTGSTVIPSVLAYGSATVFIQGTVDIYASGTIRNTASVLSPTYDPDLGNNITTLDTPIASVADISITKLASPSPVTANDLLTYTLTVSNAGPSAAEDVMLTDLVPSEITNPELSLDGTTWQAWSSPYALGTLPVGTVLNILIRGRVAASAAGAISNTATVNSTTPDPNPDDNTSTVTTPVNESANLAIVKTGDQNPVPAGGVLTYTLTVTNAGPSDAQNLVVTDPVPPELTTVVYSDDNGISWDVWTGTVALGTLAAGAVATLLLRGTVAATATGTLTNTATVASDTPDPDLSDNTSTLITPINTSADLAMLKTAAPSPVFHGDTLTYTLTAENLGPDAAQNVIITDNVPVALTNVVFSTDAINWQPWSGAYTIATLAENTSETILIQGTVSATASGVITNIASVTSDTPDPNPNNNTRTRRTPVALSADLSLTKTVEPETVNAGQTLTYTIMITNLGIDDAQNVALTDDLPPVLQNPEVSLDGINWSPWQSPYALGTVAVGAGLSVFIRGTVDPAASAQSVANTATVDSDTPDPDTTNNSDTVDVQITPAADIAVTKIGDENPVIAGDTLTYTLEITNYGPSDAQNVTLIDRVPASMLQAEYSVDDGATWLPWPGTHPLGTVASGVVETVRIRGLVSPATSGSSVNTAIVDSVTPDPDRSNNRATETTEIDTSADMAVGKTASPSPVDTGQVITYTIVLTNAGPSYAQGVVLHDPMPTDILDTEYSLDGGLTWDDWTGSLPIGTVSNGGAVTVLVRGMVAQESQGPLTNTAEVDAQTPDPDLTNNTATVVTPVYEEADLSIEKTADNRQVQAGDVVTYTLSVENLGPSDAEQVIVSDPVPPGLEGAEYSVDDGVTWAPWGGSVAVGLLAAGEVLSILLQGTVSATAMGRITNTATVTSDTPDPDLSNNKDVLSVTVTADPPSREDVINQLVSSIAMEELGLSHIINAEGEKLQYILGTLSGISGPSSTVADVLTVNSSVTKMMQSVVLHQMLLREKLRQALEGYQPPSA